MPRDDKINVTNSQCWKIAENLKEEGDFTMVINTILAIIAVAALVGVCILAKK